jgi:hypothetical protein
MFWDCFPNTLTALSKDEKTQAVVLLSLWATMSSSGATRMAAHHTPAQRGSSQDGRIVTEPTPGCAPGHSHRSPRAVAHLADQRRSFWVVVALAQQTQNDRVG